MHMRRSALVTIGIGAFLWGAVIAQETSGDHAQVRAVLEAWCEGVTKQDLEALEGLCAGDFQFFPWAGAPPRRGVAAMMEEFKAPSAGAAYTTGEAQIRVEDRTAVAGPVYVITPYSGATWRFTLRKSNGAWQIAEIACLGGIPIELKLTGLGGDYLELAER